MNFNLLYRLKNSRYQWINILFYLACALLVIIIFSYVLLAYKVYLLKQKNNELDQKLSLYGSAQQKASEKQVFDYKKKINDFTKIIDNHKVFSNLFNFIEQKTLSHVWFSGISVSEVKGEINLLGEAKNMETLSKQVNILEESKDYVKSISIFSSQVTEKGTINFTLNILLYPKIFNFNNADFPMVYDFSDVSKISKVDANNNTFYGTKASQ